MDVKLRVVAAVALGCTAGVVFAVWRGLSRPMPGPPGPMVSVSAAAPVLPPPEDPKVLIPWLPRTVARFEAAFLAAAQSHRIDPEMLAIVTLVESGGWVGAESPTGARGLMQIMPATGKAIGDERGLSGHVDAKLGVPDYNIDFGAWYFARMLERFRTDDLEENVRRAAAAYNGGPTRLAKHLVGEAELSEQTQRYRHWVGDMWAERRQSRSPTYEEWLAAGGERLIAKAEAEMTATNP